MIYDIFFCFQRTEKNTEDVPWDELHWVISHRSNLKNLITFMLPEYACPTPLLREKNVPSILIYNQSKWWD